MILHGITKLNNTKTKIGVKYRSQSLAVSHVRAANLCRGYVNFTCCPGKNIPQERLLNECDIVRAMRRQNPYLRATV